MIIFTCSPKKIFNPSRYTGLFLRMCWMEQGPRDVCDKKKPKALVIVTLGGTVILWSANYNSWLHSRHFLPKNTLSCCSLHITVNAHNFPLRYCDFFCDKLYILEMCQLSRISITNLNESVEFFFSVNLRGTVYSNDLAELQYTRRNLFQIKSKLKSGWIYYALIALKHYMIINTIDINQSVLGKCNLISVWFDKISAWFLCVYVR